MLAVHKRGKGIAGGSTLMKSPKPKVDKTHFLAREAGYPLRCTLERLAHDWQEIAESIRPCGGGAKRRRHEHLTLEHVLYGIASEPSGRKLIERCGGSAPVLRQALDHFFKTYMESLDEPTKDVYQTLAVQRVLDSALAHVKSAGRDRGHRC